MGVTGPPFGHTEPPPQGGLDFRLASTSEAVSKRVLQHRIGGLRRLYVGEVDRQQERDHRLTVALPRCVVEWRRPAGRNRGGDGGAGRGDLEADASDEYPHLTELTVDHVLRPATSTGFRTRSDPRRRGAGAYLRLPVRSAQLNAGVVSCQCLGAR